MITVRQLFVILISLLSACTHKTTTELPQEAIISPAEHKIKTATVSSWQLRGALAAKNQSKGWTATMHWVQNGRNAYQIRLMGPLGAGAVIITGHGNSVTLQDGAKKTTANNAEALLLQQTGMRIPVNNLYYWVRGLPAPSAIQSQALDKSNHLQKLQQSGYTIEFTKYTTVNGVELPTVIRMEGNGMMVKVLIKSWAL